MKLSLNMALQTCVVCRAFMTAVFCMSLMSRIFLKFAMVLILQTSTMAEPLPRSVLIFDQNDLNSPWSIAFRATVRSIFSDPSAAPIAQYIEVLDLGRFNGPRYEELLQTYLSEKYRDKPIGVIVAHGSGSLDVTLRLRGEIWPAVPIVFGFVDTETAARSANVADITGTILRSSLRSGIIAARAVIPQLKQIVYVGTPLEHMPFARHFARELPELSKEVNFIDLSKLSLLEIKKRVATLPDDAAIIYTALTVDGAGQIYRAVDALAAIAEVANRPIITFAETQIGYGATGGFVESPVLVAQDTARLALRVMNGEKASSIPVTVGNFTKPIFDWRKLQRFGVNESMLPPGSEIRFRPSTMWEQYRWQILTAVAIMLTQGLMIFALLVERRRRRLAEVESRRHLLEVMHLNRIATAGEMSASIAHEINQPLAAIVSNASAGLRWLSKTTPDLEEVAETLKRIVGDGHRASQVIESIRAMFKKDARESILLDINELIREVIPLSHVELRDHQISVDSVLTEGLPRVLADRTQLQQVMLNLVRNSIEAMAAVTDRARVLRVRSEASESSEVIITIEDSGSGIDPKNLDRIFEPFFTTKFMGMGMGLSICRSIVEAHGGRLWASPSATHGSVFHVALPIPSDA